jgi:hypothetical protein
MKHLFRLFALLVLTQLGSCSKRPSGFVGSWQTGEEGFFSSSTMVLQLKKDGSSSVSANNTLGAAASLKSSWEVKGKKLLIHEGNGSVSDFEIIGHSESELVLKDPASGKITNYRRVGN